MATLKQFSNGMITGNVMKEPKEYPVGKIEWRRTDELRWNETVDKVMMFTVRYKQTLQQKWIGFHAGEVLKVEWRDVPVNSYYGRLYE